MCDQIILSPGIKKISILRFFFFFPSNVIEATWVKPISLYPAPSDFNIAKHTDVSLAFQWLYALAKLVQSFIDLNIYFGKSSHN